MLQFLIFFVFVWNVNCWSPRDPLCQNANASCSYQFHEKMEDFCRMIYYPINNSTACDEAFTKDIVHYSDIYLGDIILTPYYGDKRTVFNITCSNIKWKKLKIRFSHQTMENVCMVKEFFINATVQRHQLFIYDCPWQDSLIEYNQINFDFVYGRNEFEAIRRHTLFVPPHEILAGNSDEVFIFMYVDVTNLKNLILKLQPPMKKFNISHLKVEVHYSLNNNTQVSSNTVNISSMDTFIEFHYNTYGIPGEYYFTVQPIGVQCNKFKCVKQHTPTIFIPQQDSVLLVGIVGVSMLIPIFIIILYMWTQKWPIPKGKRPNILLITTPTNNAHAIVAPALAEFLANTYNVNVMIDIYDVPKIYTKNSLDWLKMTIPHATHIVFLTSNDKLSSSKVVYQDTYLQTMHLLNPKDRKKECILSFCYSNCDYPELAHITKRFKFDKDFNRFIDFILNKKASGNYARNDNFNILIKAIELIKTETDSKQNNIEIIVNVDYPECEQCKSKTTYDYYSDSDALSVDLGDTSLLVNENNQDDTSSNHSIESHFNINSFSL